MPRAHRAVLATLALLLVASETLAQVEPLSSDTVGASPQTVTPPGYYSLDVDKDVNLGGFIFKDGHPFIHNEGGASAHNTAVGLGALVSATPGVPSGYNGTYNTAFGMSALRYNTTGYNNTANGAFALRSNVTGYRNTAVGALALSSNTTGYNNTASGAFALQHNTTGEYNTANGAFALQYNTTGWRNAATGAWALRSSTTGYDNTAAGVFALRSSTTGFGNTAGGAWALRDNTTGYRNTALGSHAGETNTTGHDNIWIANYGGTESNTLRIGKGTGTGDFQQTRAFISGIRSASGTFDQSVCTSSSDQLGPCAFLPDQGDPADENTAFGRNALANLTPGSPEPFSGTQNTAFGESALENDTVGYDNTALGFRALRYNTDGRNNTAVGSMALESANALTPSANMAIGARALQYNTEGDYNTASGAFALWRNTTGSNNTALGIGAGYFNLTGSDSIWIGSWGQDESHTLRIGGGTGTGILGLTRAFISGVRNATGSFDQNVCVDSSTDQLGPCAVSSARFKEDIADLAADSEALFDLHPVRFHYKAEFVGREEEQPIQYGLIAEEVAEIYPQLVTYDAEGKPMTVRYEALTPLLLNELKKQRVRVRTLEGEVERLSRLEARLVRLEAAEAARESPSLVAQR